LNGYSKTAGGFILALMVAVAFTGAPEASPIGIKAECQDGIDQDMDGDFDDMDLNCWEYPFADGGGEFPTTFGPSGKGFNSDEGYTMSVWDWQNQVAPHMFFGSSSCFQDALYNSIDANSNGKDPSLSQYQEYELLNCN
jgi:hypothetical protein